MDGSTFFVSLICASPHTNNIISKMIKKLGLLTAGLSLAALFVGCQKEKTDRLMISAEGMDGTRKMYVSGLSSYGKTVT